MRLWEGISFYYKGKYYITTNKTIRKQEHDQVTILVEAVPLKEEKTE